MLITQTHYIIKYYEDERNLGVDLRKIFSARKSRTRALKILHRNKAERPRERRLKNTRKINYRNDECL